MWWWMFQFSESCWLCNLLLKFSCDWINFRWLVAHKRSKPSLVDAFEIRNEATQAASFASSWVQCDASLFYHLLSISFVLIKLKLLGLMCCPSGREVLHHVVAAPCHGLSKEQRLCSFVALEFCEVTCCWKTIVDDYLLLLRNTLNWVKFGCSVLLLDRFYQVRLVPPSSNFSLSPVPLLIIYGMAWAVMFYFITLIELNVFCIPT